MVNNEKVLSNLLQAARMGQSGISAVVEMADGPALRRAMKCQRKEYANLERDIRTLAKKLDCPVRSGSPVTRYLSGMGAKGQLLFGERDSRIAGMMIQGNTRGMIQAMKDLNGGTRLHHEVAAMTQKMLDTQKQNIRQMEPFL